MWTPALGRFKRKIMKKIYVFIIIFLLHNGIYAADFRVIKDTKVREYGSGKIVQIKEDSIVQLQDFTIYGKNTNVSKQLNCNNSIQILFNNKSYSIDFDSVVPSNTQDFFDNKYLDFEFKDYVTIDDCNFLYEGSRQNFYTRHMNSIINYNNNKSKYDEVWYENGFFYNNIGGIIINNLFVSFYNDFYYLGGYNKTIKKISPEKYHLCIEIAHKGNTEENLNLELKIPDIGKDFIIEIVFDGDYMYVYDELQNLLFTNVLVSSEFIAACKNLIRYNLYDTNKVTWPRHADGSCDYDGSKTSTTPTTKVSSATNVSKNKTMTVSENLKLRSGEATSTQVLTVMAVGTKVKILELGKTETIDGIKSNWVKVEIISGSDRDGNKLKVGMTGWCYGGYLE